MGAAIETMPEREPLLRCSKWPGLRIHWMPSGVSAAHRTRSAKA
jgi:hypothetical protein